jgi:hypothetical protein
MIADSFSAAYDGYDEIALTTGECHEVDLAT